MAESGLESDLLKTGADLDPVALAGGTLKLFWSHNASDDGVIRDIGHGKDVHGHSDDGNQ